MEKKEESKKANYKLINIRIILSILILINFLTIFGFSEQNGEQSTNLSRNITLDVLNTFGDYNEPLTETQEVQVLNVEHIIRKLAHFTIYTILGILLMCLAVTFDFTNKKRLLLSVLIGFLYASLDEFHQSYTPGRTALVTDVLIDTAGVIVGSLIVLICIKIIQNKRNKGNKEETKTNVLANDKT